MSALQNKSLGYRLYVNRAFQVFVDFFVLSFAYWLAFLIRFEFDLHFDTIKLLVFSWPYVVILQYLVLTIFGVPQFSWRYVGLRESVRIILAMGVASAVLTAMRLGLVAFGGYFKFVIIPLGVIASHYLLSIGGIIGVRVVRRLLMEYRGREERRAPSAVRIPTLLIGAGDGGVVVAREADRNPAMALDVKGFVDDDPQKRGRIISGYRVMGNTGELKAVVKKTGAQQAVITIASAAGSDVRRIVKLCEAIDLQVRIVPGMSEIVTGKVGVTRIRQVTIEDLLGREVVELDTDAIGGFLTGRCVVVTGAGGSIGSEICRQVARFDPEKLVLIEQAENALFSIHQEFRNLFPQTNVRPVIADVCDAERIDTVFGDCSPDVVFHAAAHKHVPMMEWNPGEAVKNNVFGTKTVADLAARHGVDEFVMISTDKAVNPTSVMGATKRVAEMYIQTLTGQSKTKFVAVRFGNVLGSAGSVIPTFKKQIAAGGPVTVTHAEMQRYFMTIPEASQLVIQAAVMGHGGEIFVLDMGEPVFIVDLARDLIRLSGFSEEEIPIKISGLRPGEKLFEELATDGETIEKTRHAKIFIGQFLSYTSDKVARSLEILSEASQMTDAPKVRAALAEVVPEMTDE